MLGNHTTGRSDENEISYTTVAVIDAVEGNLLEGVVGELGQGLSNAVQMDVRVLHGFATALSRSRT